MNYGQMGAMMAWAEEEANRRYEEELEQMNNYTPTVYYETPKITNRKPKPRKSNYYSSSSYAVNKQEYYIRRKRELIKEGIDKEQAEKQASVETREWVKKQKEEEEKVKKEKQRIADLKEKYDNDWTANKVTIQKSKPKKSIQEILAWCIGTLILVDIFAFMIWCMI